jgi:triacylglycerol lipase
MRSGGVPVVLVHGWKSNPGIWRHLIETLDEALIEYWTFDHSRLRDQPLECVARSLRDYVALQREIRRYDGPLDIVCHSMGGVIARFMLEVLDGESRDEEMRQLIAIGTPNDGSSMCELFMDPELGPGICRSLEGVFVPRGYTPSRDLIVQDFRPGSGSMQRLRDAGTRRDIDYRLILGGNITGTPDFFPIFEGRTWNLTADGSWETTFAGDGVVSHADSCLKGAGLDIIPTDPVQFEDAPARYYHVQLPVNPECVDRIVRYLRNPSTRSCSVSPAGYRCNP